MNLFNLKVFNPKQSSKKAFTLIEMLVYISILTIIISAVVVLAIGSIRAGGKIKANADVLDNERRALEILSYEIKKAQNIYTPTSVFGTNPGQLSLQQAAATSTDEKITFVDFFKCGDSLCLRREGGIIFNITGNRVRVTELKFSQLLNSSSSLSVQIILGLESAGTSLLPDYSSSMQSTTTFLLRGY